MVYYEHKLQRYAIAFNAKCGCTTIGKWILSQQNHKIVEISPWGKYYGNNTTDKFISVGYRVGIIRDPVDRLVKVFMNKISNPENPNYYNKYLSFDQFINYVDENISSHKDNLRQVNEHWRPQWLAIRGCDKVYDLSNLTLALVELENKFDLFKCAEDLEDVYKTQSKGDYDLGQYTYGPKITPTKEQIEKIQSIYARDCRLSEY